MTLRATTMDCLSWMSYPPQRVDLEGARELRSMVYAVKDGTLLQGMEAAGVVVRQMAPLPPAWTPYAWVPCPRSSVTDEPVTASARWPALRVCAALAQRFGGHVFPLLRRVVAVPRSSKAASIAGRVTLRAHVESMRAMPPIGGLPAPVILVDDVVTTGTMFVAARAVLEASGVRVRGCLAVARTEAAAEVRWVQQVIELAEGADHATRP